MTSLSSATAEQKHLRQRRPLLAEEPLLSEEEGSETTRKASRPKYLSTYSRGPGARPFSFVKEWRLLTLILVIAIGIRLFNITRPDSVVFDEVHFGGFAGKYLNGTFFMDVHPPLAKLMIAGAGKLAGYDGQFNFSKIGMDYIQPGVPYVAMRLLPAFQGLLLIPIAYLTLRAAGSSVSAASLAALALTFENGLITQSRFILLDAALILFTALTTLFWFAFLAQANAPFSLGWWSALLATGFAMGLTVSCKWVGLFLIALIGLSTVANLWALLDDPQMTPARYARHFGARALALIGVPTLVYLLSFYLHFLALPLQGPGAAFMSAEFQTTLSGSTLNIHPPADIAYGAKIYLRHANTRGGYLHSHASYYPKGSKQQQITAYPFKDDNSAWTIQKRVKPDVPYNETYLEWVRNGDVIRLEHFTSFKKLHSHDHKAPVTEADYHKEVSAYGFPDFEGDDNDLWTVEIYDWEPSVPESRDRLISIHSRFRLRHYLQKCHLFSHKVKLPAWGFEQQEVTCISSGKPRNALWRIDGNVNSRLPPDAPTSEYVRPSFLARVLELNQVMWTTNAGLTSSHPYDSHPSSWPLLTRGINFWTKPGRQVYLIGNPLVWWASTAALGLWLLAQLLIHLRAQRGYTDHLGGMRGYLQGAGGFLILGWTLHYLPFWIMGRQLFLHHYFPALYYATLLGALEYDVLTRRLPPLPRRLSAVLLLLPVIAAFALFSPYTYGLSKSHAWCTSSKWLSTWDFDCSRVSDPPAKKTPIITASPIPLAPPVDDKILSEDILPAGEEVKEEEIPEEIPEEGSSSE